MRKFFAVMFIGVFIVLWSCSSDSLKRTGYETLRNVNRQQCEKELSADCMEQESYDDYRKRYKKINEPMK